MKKKKCYETNNYKSKAPVQFTVNQKLIGNTTTLRLGKLGNKKICVLLNPYPTNAENRVSS